MDPEDVTRTQDVAGRTGPRLGVVAAVGSWPRDVAVVERAAQEAERRGGSITLLHVDQERYAMSGADEEYVGRHVAAEHEVLAAAAEHARSLGRRAPVQTALYVGAVTDGILRTAHTAALVVLGAEGPPWLLPCGRGYRSGGPAGPRAWSVVPAGGRGSGARCSGGGLGRGGGGREHRMRAVALAGVVAAQAALWDVPTEEVALPGHPGADLPGLDEHDLVVVLRGLPHAPCGARGAT